MNAQNEKGPYNGIKRFIAGRREIPLLILIIGMSILLTIITEGKFVDSGNLTIVLKQISLIVIVAMGETLVLISAGIDLSVGAVLGFSGILSALAFSMGMSTPLSILIGLATGVLVGLINGIFIAKLKINPFIITLGMMSIARGLVLGITKGYSISVKDNFIINLGQSSIGPFPTLFIIMMVIVIVMSFIVEKTVFGNYVKAIGGNEEAAKISGINIAKNKIVIYIISSFVASIAGVLMLGRLLVAQPTSGQGWELDAVAAAIIGGTSLSGGEGSMIGTLFGASLIGIISNGLVLLRVSLYWQQVVTGVIIISVVIIDSYTKKRK